jgi:hypothetical protein
LLNLSNGIYGTALLEREEMHKTLGRMLDELDAKDRRIAELELKLESRREAYC